MGCFAKGCLTLLIVGFLGLVALVGGAWFLTTKAVSMFTAPAPAEVALEMPSEAEYAAAEGKLAQMREAARSAQATTIAFTAADLNALIARHSDFAAHKGKTRIDIADSIATIELSVPLVSFPWRRVQSRWFNGSARLGFLYDDDGFTFDPQWIEANGHQLSGPILRSFASSFSQSFTTGFRKGLEKNDGSAGFWGNVKSITLEGDTLVVTTRAE